MALNRLQQLIGHYRLHRRGYRYAGAFTSTSPPNSATGDSSTLERFFDEHTAGPGLWKWRHYFDVYDRHLARFRGRSPRVLEIGVYAGGSILMWRDYFGDACEFHGVDIDPATRAHEQLGARMHIGDQANPRFWAQLLPQIGPLDVVLDDGGHEPEQQITTLEAVLPQLLPGGVYVCEDAHGTGHGFHHYLTGLVAQLHASIDSTVVPATRWQQSIGSIHAYPYVTIIEARERALREFRSEMHGSECVTDAPLDRPRK